MKTRIGQKPSAFSGGSIKFFGRTPPHSGEAKLLGAKRMKINGTIWTNLVSVIPREGYKRTHRFKTHITGDADDADVIPLQYLGACGNDLSSITAQDLLDFAINNCDESREEGAYAIRHGSKPMNTFGQPHKGATDAEKEDVLRTNPMASMFTTLFPFDEGGIEAKKRRPVGFIEHVRWALQYHDHRFRTHHSFPFVAFGIEQRRQALRSARVHVSRKDLKREAHVLSDLTLEDLRQAAADEEKGGASSSNPRVKTLRRHLKVMGAKVLGSDEARAANRSKIWSTVVMKNPPSLWVTINPADIHDPVAQIFAGEEINMEDFCDTVGPDKDRRARNIARDPYAAAKFYNFIIHTVFQTLLGINATGSSVHSTMGLVGVVSAYYGMTEAQGRGTLHLHLLLWLEDAPTAEEMAELLKGEEFREKVSVYIKKNIRSHLRGFDKEGLKNEKRDSAVPYSRPPNPKMRGFTACRRAFERRVVRASQVHTCRKGSCLKYSTTKGRWKCKRRAPFKLSRRTTVDENGNWRSRRTYGYLNSWHPWIAVAMRCNHDIKLLTHGRETRHVVWYVTTYATKKQNKTYNMSALLARGLRYHFQPTTYIQDAQDRNRLLLYRCLEALNRESEKSAPQVISYLMGWGDNFASHKYVPVFWSSVEALLCRRFEEFSPGRGQAR